MAVQSTQSCVTWTGEVDATAGSRQPAADVHFYLDIDPSTGLEMVHVSDPKPQRRQPEFLTRHIARLAFAGRIKANPRGAHAVPYVPARTPVALLAACYSSLSKQKLLITVQAVTSKRCSFVFIPSQAETVKKCRFRGPSF